MDFDTLIAQMSPEIYKSLKLAVEIGKWPNGEVLTEEQRASCLEAVIAWDIKHKPEEQRIAYIETRSHSHCGEKGDIAQAENTPPEEKPLTWKH